MNRRRLLAAAAAGVAGGLAGCAGEGSQEEPESSTAPFEHPGTLATSFAANGEYPNDGDPADGFPPSFSDAPPATDADPSSFATLDVNGESVRLAPIDVVETWYRRGEARVVDARGLTQYERAHVYGAVLSPAQEGSVGGGIDGWPTDARIITYCGCPHHLSALDEGFEAWSDAGHPMGGTAFKQGTTSRVSEWRIDGESAAADAGAYAWASHGRQYEAAPIRSDGSFTLHLAFSDVNADTPVRISTPAYARTRPLGELADRIES